MCKDGDKTKEQLVKDLTELRQRIAELEAVETRLKRVEQELHSHSQRLRILHEIYQAILAARSPEAIAQAALGHIRQLVPCQGASIVMTDFETGEATVFVTDISGEPPVQVGRHISRETLAGLEEIVEMFRKGEAVVVQDLLAVPQPLPVVQILRVRDRRSLLSVPLVFQEKVIGVLMLGANSPNAFTPEHVQVAQEVAHSLAVAIRQARLLEEARARWHEAETLRQAGAAVTETLSLDETLDRILEQLDRVAPYDSASIQLKREGYAEIVSGRGFSEPEAILGLRFPVPGDNPNTAVIEGRKTLILADAQAAHPPFRKPPHDHLRSWLGVPLIVRGRAIGMLTLDSVEPGHFNEEHIRLVTPFAHQAAIAVENARLFEESRRQTRELAGLYDTALAISSELEAKALLRRLHDQVQRLMAPDTFVVVLYDADAEEYQVALAVEEGETVAGAVGMRMPLEDGGLTGWVMRERQSLLVGDLEVDPLPIEPWHGTRPARSWLGVPLVVRDRLLGAISVQSFHPQAFGDANRRFLESLAAQVAIAIENVRLVEGLEVEVAARTAEIRDEQEKSEAILRSVGEAVVMTDVEMRIRYINAAFTALTGYTAQRALGHHVDFWLGESLSEQDWQALQRVLVKGRIWQGEVTVRCKDGRAYEAALTVAPMRDAEGRLMGYVSSHHDISQRKELERARRRFIDNVSHQLRTPVTNMKLYAQLVRKGLRPERMQHYLSVLEEQADQLTHLVNDILLITELDSGQAVTTWEPVPVSTLIGDVITRYQGKAREAGVTLVLEPFPPDLSMVKGDRFRLDQALGELVENAITFTPSGGRVTVEAKSVREGEQELVAISVRDTGPGISPEERKRIFDRFYRGSLAEPGTIPGVGLGLSIVDEIVRAHGGEVTVESEVGQGSTFTLWLRSGPSV